MGVMAWGSRQYASWVRAPEGGLLKPHRGAVSQREMINGQVQITRPRNLRKEFGFIFKGSDVDLQTIRDFIDGRYGDGPWTFSYPRALNGNMLPRTWSQPARSIGVRGNQAMDFFSNAFVFGAPLSATLNNPNEQALAITGLSGAPATGAVMWSPNSTAPVWPANYASRPWLQILVPPNYALRFTVWGLQNTANSPGVYYALSTISPANTTVPAGTLIAPTLAGASITPATSASWRVLDLWIGAGSSVTATDYTNFGAMDLRMALTAPPAVPTAFDFGRGQFQVNFSETSVGEVVTWIGPSDAQTFYEVDGTCQEVSQPW